MSDESKTKADENAKPTDAPTPEPSQPVDTPVETTPHPNYDVPEEHLGEVIADPWEDDSQTDWPNGHIDYPGLEANR